MDKNTNKNIHGKPQISSGHDIAMTSSKWLGACFFYLLNLGKIKFSDLWSSKYSQRNLWVGYFIKLLLLAITLFGIWHVYLKNA